MHAALTQRRNLVLIVVLLTLVFSLSFFQHAGYQPSVPQIETPLNDEPVNPSIIEPQPNINQDNQESSSAEQPSTSDEVTSSEPPKTVCDQVDMDWLASDRTYWDGWASKAMFMTPEGQYTTENVTITAGESICVVVLLGPIPAVAAIKPEVHHAPADSITIHAVADNVKIPITMHQHQRKSNVYYAPVRFMHPEVYRLESTTEYRSYFWETPIYHEYRPFHYQSLHNLIVKEAVADNAALPSCDVRYPEQLQGSWVNKTVLREATSFDPFGEAQEEDQLGNGYVFVPDQCKFESISDAQAAQCFDGKTVHVWADGNVRRNLKVFSSANRWCNEQPSTDARCICNDDDEDEQYPWVTDPNAPLHIGDVWNTNIDFYFNRVGSIGQRDWRDDMRQRASQLPRADLVIVGVGNEDIALNRLTPLQFEHSLKEFLTCLVNEIYPEQTIIVRTPQYFCCGTIPSSSWNAGRSRAFMNVVSQQVKEMGDRVLLWDVYRLGVEDNMCVSAGSSYTRRNVINLENQLLWNLICKP